MAEKEIVKENKEKEIVEEIKEENNIKSPKEERKPIGFRKPFDKEAWKPKTEIGRKVKLGEIKKLGDILDKGVKVLEPEIIDCLFPNLEIELIESGQSKGKFGGGKRSIWRQTQKKTKEGNRMKFSTIIAVGNKDGYVGLGKGKAKETVPAREKAIRNSKINVIKIRRACGSWSCGCGESHSIPYKVGGKCSSVIIELRPAPKGTGLVVEDECKKIISLAGVKDVYSKSYGKKGTKQNLVYACFDALKQLTKIKVNTDYIKKSGLVEGSIKDGE